MEWAQMKIDFFIIGAPKCGTTSLVEYLSSHPDIYFSKIKEPHYFSTDFPGYQVKQDYESFISTCFPFENENEMIYGEGSVFYLYSAVAIKNILNYNPNAKFIIMLRNPIDLVYSLHAQLLLTSDEKIISFSDAWKMCEIRRSHNKQISNTCREPLFLQYDKMGLLGQNLERFYNIVPENQRKTIIFDNFITNTKQVYEDTLSFLGLDYDGRDSFPRVNANTKVYSQIINSISRYPPEILVWITERIKKYLGIETLFIGSLLHYAKTINTIEIKREPLPESFRLELYDTFKEDIHKIEDLVNVNLSHWR
jgi:hypothetical protein